MLKQRVITALLLLFGFLVCLFWLESGSFAVVITLVAGLCGWEWAALAGLRNTTSRLLYALIIVIAMSLLQFVFYSDALISFLAIVGLLWWMSIIGLLYLKPVALLEPEKYSCYYLAAGPVTLLTAFMMAQYLRHSAEIGSPWLLLYALALVWAMDVGAYFAGKRYGHTKLAPSISPGKTIEGLVGGVATALLLYLLVLVLRSESAVQGTTLLLATICSAAISVLGDLYESRAKRMVGLKDSGSILPGHGGVLDRLDSALAALPVFGFFLIWV